MFELLVVCLFDCCFVFDELFGLLFVLIMLGFGGLVAFPHWFGFLGWLVWLVLQRRATLQVYIVCWLSWLFLCLLLCWWLLLLFRLIGNNYGYFGVVG